MPSSEVMHKWKMGKLHSGGPGGPVVTDQDQAIAIKLSEQRKEKAHGGRYPEKHHKHGHRPTARDAAEALAERR